MAVAAGPTDAFVPVVRDAAGAVKLVLYADRHRLLRCFVYVPTGIFVILAACYGVHVLLALGNVSFPASVACLVLLFVALLLCDWLLGERRTKRIVRVINVPGGWSLRWLNIFFTPSFVMLALSPSISGAEVGKIIAVFVLGFVAMMIFTAYMTRAIQRLHRPRKLVDGHGHDESELVLLRTAAPEASTVPSAVPSAVPSEQPSANASAAASVAASAAASTDALLAPSHPPPVAPPPAYAAAYITIRGQNLDDPLSSFSDVLVPHPPIVVPMRPPHRPRSERWAEWMGAHADTLFFAAVLVFVGLPVYYAADYAMPLQLSVNILMFFTAMALPPSWRQVLHPVLVSAFSTLLILWLLGRVHGVRSLTVILDEYRAQSTYLALWAAAGTPSAKTLAPPGAGDVLASAMDASIVSLALPMYQYRNELKRHFVAIILPNIVLSITSLFVYPIVCYHIGISPERSLAFTSRSLTLALATPAVKNLGGDANTVAAVALISGVLGVLIGRQMLRWMRIPEDDYITRGVTFGANASALGTALLLRTEPRAAAISSLAMSLFGTVTVAFSSIPPMVHIIRSLVGLS